MMVNPNQLTLKKVLEQAQKLPSAEKATLISTLLTTSELSVVLRSSHQSEYVIRQIGLMSAEELSEVIYAIAERVASFSG